MRQLALLSILGLWAACGGDDAPSADGAASGPPAPIAGIYEVEGFTVDAGTGDNKRRISGTVILATEGDRYTATFDLDTVWRGPEGDHEATVIGKGEGTIDGRQLDGNAETQLVMSAIPGVDPAFAFVPRQTSTRIESTSVATIAADGSTRMKIENVGRQGEPYTPTRTTLRGVRVGDAALGGGTDLPGARARR